MDLFGSATAMSVLTVTASPNDLRVPTNLSVASMFDTHFVGAISV